MTQGAQTIFYPVKDVAQAKKLYSALLGAPPTVDQPHYVGFDVGGQHIGLNAGGHESGMTGPVPYWHVDDIHATFQQLVDSGARVLQEVTDVGYGRHTASLADADGNVIGLMHCK